jgi:hypothetical protein
LLDSETRLSEAIDESGDRLHGGPQHAGHRDHSSQSEHENHVDDPYNIHTCPMPSHYHVLHYGPGNCPDCGMHLVPIGETEHAPVYVCPMPECGIATTEPGACPVCNMNLIEYQPEATRDH